MWNVLPIFQTMQRDKYQVGIKGQTELLSAI
jgi:hypothetical protein